MAEYKGMRVQVLRREARTRGEKDLRARGKIKEVGNIMLIP